LSAKTFEVLKEREREEEEEEEEEEEDSDVGGGGGLWGKITLFLEKKSPKI